MLVKKHFSCRTALTILFGALLLIVSSNLAGCAPETTATSAPTIIPTLPAASTDTPRVTETQTPVETELPVVPPIGVSPDALVGVNLSFWHAWQGEREALVNELVAAFNAANEYGIVVSAAGQEDIAESIRQALSQGTPPQVAAGFNFQAALWERRNQVIVDLTPYYQSPDYGLSAEALDDFYPSFLLQDRAGDRQIAWPLFRTAQAIFYNASWARELGFDRQPETIEAFRTQACAAAQATGGWMLDANPSTVLGWLYAFGAMPVDDGGGYAFLSDPAAASFAFLRDLKSDGCAWTPENDLPFEEFATRKALFFSTTILGIPQLVTAFERAGNPDTWELIPFPAQAGVPVVVVSGPSLVAFEASPEEQLASWLFIKWMSEPEQLVRWSDLMGVFPVRRSALSYLEGGYWDAMAALIPGGVPEPGLASWGTVRWAVSDAADALFYPFIPPADVDAILTELDLIAAEIEAGIP